MADTCGVQTGLKCGQVQDRNIFVCYDCTVGLWRKSGNACARRAEQRITDDNLIGASAQTHVQYYIGQAVLPVCMPVAGKSEILLQNVQNILTNNFMRAVF